MSAQTPPSDPNGGGNAAPNEPLGNLIWSFGAAVLDESTLQLSVGGVSQVLERKPMEVLRHLLRHAGELVTKEELHQAIWPGRVLSETVLTKSISRIREVLADEQQRVIKTVHGYGYRLIAEVKVEACKSRGVAAVLGLKAGDAPPLRPQWRLQEHLTSGGSGELWRAVHHKTAEVRVFKFALDAAALTALRREITLYRLLNTQLPAPAPLAAILDWNIEEPPCFIESRYYPLGNLADWLNSFGGCGAVPMEERLRVFVQIAEAVAQVHAVGVLHKDLKPQNILMKGRESEPATPLLTDFGASGVVDEDLLGRAGITQMGFTRVLDTSTTATPLYAAPELMQGQPNTTKSDVYALGVILYQLLAGDLRRPIAPGWEGDVADELLRDDIAAAVQGNPERRTPHASALASSVRNLRTRRHALEREREEQAERQRVQAQVAAAVQENNRLRARRNWLMAVLGVFALGIAATVIAALKAKAASEKAERAAASAQAVTGFLTDDLLGAMDVGKLHTREVDVPQVLDYAASKIDSRFGDDLAGRAQAWVSVMAAYRRFPSKPRQQLLPLWRKHYQALTAYFHADPAAAFPMAYKVAKDQPELDYLPQHLAMVGLLKDYVQTADDLGPATKTQVRMLYASLLMQSGDWQRAASLYAELQPEIDRLGDSLLELSPWPMATAVRDNATLQQFDAAKRGCERLQSYAVRHREELSIVHQVDLLFACGAYASYAGDFPRLLQLAEQGRKVAQARFADESGEMQTFSTWRGTALVGLGRLDQALKELDAAVASRERTQSGIYLAGSLLQRSWCYERMGRPTDALNDAARASELLLTRPDNPRLIAGQATYARLLAQAGRVQDAGVALAAIPAALLKEVPKGHRHWANYHRAEARIALANAEPQKALAAAQRAEQALAAAFGAQHLWTHEARDDVPRPNAAPSKQ